MVLAVPFFPLIPCKCKHIVFHFAPPSSCFLGLSVLLSLNLYTTRRLFPLLCYLFCDFPQAISLSTPIFPLYLSFPLSLSLSGWPSTSFISACSSVYLPSFWGALISFSISLSLSYMLGKAPCIGVNEVTAWANTREDREAAEWGV